MRIARLPILVAVGALLAADVAFAQATPPDPGVGQISQYIETIPSAGGGVPTIGRKKGRKARQAANLSSKARREVERKGNEDADVLIEIAASSTTASAAPRKPKESAPHQPKESERKTPERSSSQPPSLPVETADLLDGVRVAIATTAGRTRFVAMGVILVLVTTSLVVSSRGRIRADAQR